MEKSGMSRQRSVTLVIVGFLGCNSPAQHQASGASGAAEVPSAVATTTGTVTPMQAVGAQPDVTQPATAKPQLVRQAEAAAAAAPTDGKPVVEVHISVNGVTMKYDVTTITASAEQRVHVILENKLPGTLPHNWTLVMPGTEAAVAADGLKQGPDSGYFAPGPNVLAHSEMIAPGETTDLTFNAPKDPGKYPYICTFPGHYMMMKGVLEVTP
jgi:azurin